MILKTKKFFHELNINFKMYALLISHAKVLTIIVILLSILLGLLPLIGAIGMSLLATNFINNGNNIQGVSCFLVGIITLSWISEDVISTIKSYAEFKICKKVEYPMLVKLNSMVSKIDLRTREQKTFQDVLTRAQQAIDPNTLTDMPWYLMNILTKIVTVVSCAVLIYRIHFILPIIAFSIIGLLLKEIKKNEQSLSEYYNYNALEQRLLNQYSGLTMGRVSGSELRIYRGLDWAANVWRNAYKPLKKKRLKKQHRHTCNNNKVYGSIEVLSYFILLSYLILGNVTIDNIVAVIALGTTLSNATFGLVTSISRLFISNFNFINFFKLESLADDGIREKGEDAEKVSIELNDVYFKYADKAPYALDQLSIKIKNGEKVAIVGENGSGKTTLAKLILQLYHPEKGSLIVKDTNNKIGTYKASVVQQDFEKYYFTLKENIIIGDYSNKDNTEKLKHVINNLGINDLVDKVGLDTQLGTTFGGKELSGGEWQKLVLARAFFANPTPLIVFDEPNSALDALTEAKIIQQMIEGSKEKTCIFISHRLSSVIRADRILVMEKGKVVQEGSHQELIRKEGLYKKMFEVQAINYQI